MVAAGCRSAPPPPPPSELRAGIRSIGSLDPLRAEGTDRAASEGLVLRQLFEGLVRYNARTLAPEPALAASWQASPDARTFTFLLRKGARFHSGREVAPEDVVFSLNRLARAACAPAASPAAGAPSYLLSLVVGYPEVAGTCKAPALSGVTVLGDRTVVVALSEPWADFPSVLGNPAAAVVPSDLVSADEDRFSTHPVGTGPYRLEAPWDGRSVTLARFDEYWGPKAIIPALRFDGYADDSAAYVDLLAGKLQYAPVPPRRVVQAQRRFGDEGFVRGTGVYFFGFNLRSQRVASPSVREALSRAVDRRALATAVFERTREPATGIASPTLPGARVRSCAKACSFDEDAARAAIAQTFPDGAPELTIGVSSEGTNPPVAHALARMFAAAGVSARVVERSFGDHVKGLAAGDVDIFQMGWIPDYPAMDGVLWPLFRSSAQDNYMRFSDPDVDRLLAQARRTVGAEDRYGLYRDAERKVVEQLPVLPLLWYRSALAFDRRLRSSKGGNVVDGLGATDFALLRFQLR